MLGHQDGVLITSCSVDFGASGAPIFSFADGTAQIVSVVSAKAEVNGKGVSLGTDLAKPLAQLRAELERTDGVFQSIMPTTSRDSSDKRRGTGGAKFVKPKG